MALTTIPSELSSVSGISDSSTSTAITIDSSQNVTFAGNITTGSNTISGVLSSVTGSLGSAATATTQAASDNSTKLATTAYVTTALANMVDSAPSTLNTLNELAAALGDDANFSTTVTNSIATKLPLAGGTLTGDINFGDNDKAIFGAGSDLQIYSDGTNSFIKETAGAGSLIFNVDFFTVQNAAGTETKLVAKDNAEVELYYDNLVKLETTSTGIDVTGAVTADGLTVDGNVTINSTTLKISGNFPQLLFEDTAGSDVDAYIVNNANGLFIGKTNSPSVSNDIVSIDLSTGNVGIGVSSPDGTLHVKDAVAQVYIQSNDGQPSQIVFGDVSDASRGRINYDSSDNMIFENTNLQERMRIAANGNVGIGADNPSHRLEVNTTSGGQQDILALLNSNTAVSNTAGLLFAPSNGIAGARIEALAIEDFSTTANRTADLLFYTRKDGTLSEKMRIDNNGNLGIGVTNPLTKLHLDSPITNAQSANSSRSYKLLEGYGYTVGGNYFGQYAIGTSYNSSTNTGTLEFFTGSGSSAPTERMRIDADGSFSLSQGTGNNFRVIRDGDNTIEVGNYNATDGYRSTNYFSSTHTFFVASAGAGSGSRAVDIDTSGRLLVGQTLAVGIGGTPADVNGTEIGKGYINLTRDDTASATQIQFGKNGVVAGSIVTTSSTTYNTTSDRRAKTNIADADDAGAVVDAIQVRKFDWKDDGTHQRYGMIAQELLDPAPELVHQPEDPEQMMGVDYSKLVPMLVKEIQSLRARVQQLENN